MPIYEYMCKGCGAALEAFQKHSDALLTDCPECGKAQLEKVLSATSFQLKGSGWYVTDFREKKKSPQKEKPEAKSSSEKTTESTSTAKSAEVGDK